MLQEGMRQKRIRRAANAFSQFATENKLSNLLGGQLVFVDTEAFLSNTSVVSLIKKYLSVEPYGNVFGHKSNLGVALDFKAVFEDRAQLKCARTRTQREWRLSELEQVIRQLNSWELNDVELLNCLVFRVAPLSKTHPLIFDTGCEVEPRGFYHAKSITRDFRSGALNISTEERVAFGSKSCKVSFATLSQFGRVDPDSASILDKLLVLALAVKDHVGAIYFKKPIALVHSYMDYYNALIREEDLRQVKVISLVHAMAFMGNDLMLCTDGKEGLSWVRIPVGFIKKWLSLFDYKDIDPNAIENWHGEYTEDAESFELETFIYNRIEELVLADDSVECERLLDKWVGVTILYPDTYVIPEKTRL